MPTRKPSTSRASTTIVALERENAALRDALEAARSEQDRLLETEQRLRAVVDHAPIVVFATDRDGVFTLSEGRGLQALGLVPGQVVGLSAFDVYREVPQIVANLRTCLAGNVVNEIVKVGALFFESLYVPRLDPDDGVAGISGVAWDITRRMRAEGAARELEAQLLQSQKMETIGTLAGGIAHDFNNILSPIMGYAELAMNDLPAEHPARGDMEQVLKAARRARDLVKQILVFSRRSDQIRRPVQLHLVVDDALKLIRSMLPSNVELSQRVMKQDDTVLADPGQMHQVIMNLATNAAHAMRATGGVLRVELASEEIDHERARVVGNVQPGRHVVLSVTDNGEGMNADTLGRIFEPFFTTKRPGEGTGLGLSVVHGILHSHGGSIEVNSTPGNGTTFRVYLPAITAHEARALDAQPSEARGNGEHVLVVDDEPAIADLLQRMLVSRGFRVTAFTASDEALQAFQSNPDQFDAIVTDQTMPRMSGTELAHAVHELRPETPVVLTTGYSDDAARPGSTGNIAGVATKPFDATTITHMLRKALDRS